MKEKNFIYQNPIIDDTSLFAVNVTSDVSNQEQQSQIDDGPPAQSASSCESSVVVENNQYNQNAHWKNKSKMQLMLVNSKLLKDQSFYRLHQSY